MALVKCPECGGAISSSALVCPHCGTPKAKLDEIRAEQIRQEEIKAAEARRVANVKAAEEARIRREIELKQAERERERQAALAKEAEEERIRAEHRREWWKKNGWKVWCGVIAVVLIVVGAIVGTKIAKNKAEQRAIQEGISIAKDYIAKGDSCVMVYRFDEAEEYYGMAYCRTDDIDVQNTVQIKRKQLPKARQAAKQEFDDTLYKLQIYLEADDYEFTPTSSALLDKMIAIDPYNAKTKYYKNMRDR